MQAKPKTRNAYAVQYLRRLIQNTAGLLGVAPATVVEQIALLEVGDPIMPMIEDAETAFRVWPCQGEKLGPQHIAPITQLAGGTTGADRPVAAAPISEPKPGDDQPGSE